MIPMMKTSWWTLHEILYQEEIPNNAKPEETNSNHNPDNWFKNLLSDMELQYNLVGIDVSNATFKTLCENIINELMTIVYNRHHEDYIYEKTLNWNDNVILTYTDSMKAVCKLINVLDMTSAKYIPILLANKSASVDLLKPMKSSSVSTNRFNDTPQDGGDYDDDNHATNVSKNESVTTADSGSLAMRLDEIFKNYRSIILEWSNEFNQLFLKEEQL